ncbi:hypothetical protein GALL_172950 [mine drainage metagenome]|uniref:DUF3347 domain-containing protein n=1 Tax=mine drainage metagenome TaxID=410659 RepID=A0A1J5S8R0_9ZZZZ
MKKLIVFGLMAMLTACGNSDSSQQIPKKESLNNIASSQPFNEAFSKLMDDYYHLKNNFIAESDTSINHYSRALIADADSLNFNLLMFDSTTMETARTAAANVSGELQGIIGEQDIENKRKSFYTLSEQLYDLIKLVQYNKEIIYRQKCDDVFDGAGATWLSNSTEIKNPYLPKTMSACGKITDTLDFRKK